MDLELGRFEFSGLRAGMYMDMMEQEKDGEIDRALLISRSAVSASESVDFKSALNAVTVLRARVVDSLPYRAPTEEVTRKMDEDYARTYKEYAESVLGVEGAEQLMKTGKLCP